jgi:hypothetical protein
VTTDGREEAIERLMKNHYSLWRTLRETEVDPSLLYEWREAPAGAQGWRKWRQHEQALEVLRASMSD